MYSHNATNTSAGAGREQLIGQNNRQARIIHIGKYRYVFGMLAMWLMSAWIINFTREVFSLDHDMLSTYQSRLLICNVVTGWYYVFDISKDTIINFMYRNKTVLESEYKKCLVFNSGIVTVLFTLCEIYSNFSHILLIGEFIPFKKRNCYDYSDNLCSNARILAVCGLLIVITVGLQLLMIIFKVYYLYRIGIIHFGPSNSERENLLNVLRSSDLTGGQSVFRHLTIFDMECPICMSDGTESGDPTFVTLNCGHKYHETCIQQWIQTGANLNCPDCRKPIASNDVTNISNTSSDNTVLTHLNPTNDGYRQIEDIPV